MSLTWSLGALLAGTRAGVRRGAAGEERAGFVATHPSTSPESFLDTPASDLAPLRSAGGRMLRRARKSRDQVSLLVMQLADLAELQQVFGPDAGDRAVEQAVKQLAHAAGGAGTVLRTSRRSFALLMPGWSAAQLLCAVQARLGRSGSIEFEVDGDEVILVPDLAARELAFGQTVTEAYDAICRELALGRSSERQRREYLRRERESHTVHVQRPGRQTAETAPAPLDPAQPSSSG